MKTFYVSPVGSDNNVGTEREQAFYTLTRARDAVREAKRSEEFHGACITVLSGQYAMAQGLHLDGQDSGTEEAPIIWKGEGDPIFSGAVSIQGFQPVTDPEILARLPKCAAPFVLECDLFAQGVRDFGVFRSRGGGFTLPSHMELSLIHISSAGAALRRSRKKSRGFWRRPFRLNRRMRLGKP